jgi:DinB superfamily
MLILVAGLCWTASVLNHNIDLVQKLSEAEPRPSQPQAVLIEPVRDGAQATAGAPQHLRSSEVMDFFVTFLEKQLVDAADAMPADKYSFAPAVGEFKGVRSFGEQVKHLAATNYILAAGALREPPPRDAGDEAGPETLRMKAEILEYLKGSFRALHRAAAAIDDGNTIVEDVPISPLIGRATRLGYVQEALIHAYDHYGQMVIYLRMNAVVPPASRDR